MSRYMVIETFYDDCLDKIYHRFHQKGRMLHDGLHYLDSWLTSDGARCFQLMETERFELFQQWFKHRGDLTRFEVFEIGQKPTYTQSQADS